ncbi:MAG: amino acid adenylation domain-containing protein [Acidobacteria bacterium]|nr:amino acid adenylation domain-containing protein [Acidobacteriota bacterium]
MSRPSSIHASHGAHGPSANTIRRSLRHERLTRLLSAHELGDALLDELAPPPDAQSFPCSFIQRALWLAHEASAPSASLTVPLLLRLVGPIDIPRLARALGAVARQHEILRTTVGPYQGAPLQSVWPAVPISLDVRELESGADRESAYRAAARAFADEPFDPSLPFPWRAVLFRTAPGDHCLALALHHLVFDGGSIPLLTTALVEAWRLGGPDPLHDDTQLQYADVSVWQHAMDRAGRFDEHVAYWAAELSDLPPPLLLGGDAGEHARRHLAGDTIHRSLDRSVADRLAAIARDQQTTMFAAGLAAWAAWLSERCGEDRVLVATPISLRHDPVFAGVIGPVLNTAILHIDVAGAGSYAGLVRHVREKVGDAVRHRHASIERVLERIRSERATHLLAQVGFTRPRPSAIQADERFPIRRILQDLPGTQADASLELDSRGTRTQLALRYSTDVFTHAAAGRALDDFTKYLGSITASPGRRMRRRAHLTPTQVRMWADQQRVPDAPLYNVASLLHIDGPVDPVRFTDAYRALVRTTDALRIGIALHPGGPRQSVLDACDVSVPLIDFSSMSSSEQDAWLHEAVHHPFDLGGPLVRTALLEHGPDRFTWVLVLHHLITDGWSVRLLCERLAALYERQDVREPGVSEPRFPGWLDHARNVRCTSGEHDAWWRTEFEGIAPLPLLGIHPQKRSTGVTRSRIPITGCQAAAIRQAFAVAGPAGTGFGPFGLIAASIVALLHRLTGAARISLGVPVHQRRTPHERATVGLFMDVVPIVVDCVPSDTIQSLASRAVRALLKSLRHGAPPTDVRERACDVLVNVQSSHTMRFGGHPTEHDWLSAGHERESLALHVWDAPARGVGIDVDTHNDVFDPEQHAAMVRWIRAAAEQCAGNPAMHVSDLQLVSEHERQQVVALGTGPQRPAAPETDIVGTVLGHSRSRPEATAIESGGTQWSYHDMADRIAAAAHTLRTCGVSSGDIVLVSGERRPEFVAAILALHAIGAAWLPVEPDLPRARLEQLRALAEPVLTIASGSDRDANVVSFDRLVSGSAELPPIARAAISAISRELLPASAHGPESVAYLIATSGSTGAPKLVTVPRRALANYTAYAVDRFALTRVDRALQFASLAFDTAIEEIFPTLLAGATLVLRDDDMLASPETFVRRLEQGRISVLNLPTSYWHQVVASGAQLPASVRLTLVGGEAMRADMVARWPSVAPTSRLLNGYGPTETTVVAAFADLTSGAAVEPVPIGHPIWNCDLIVLDACGQPAPVGAAGELVIGGAGVSSGYRKDAALTDARFTQHPIEPLRRAYRTGDRVRLRGGAFEYLGRLDSQLKVRGFRVAPEEIVAKLLEHGEVSDAVVLRSDGCDDVLRAYVVPSDSGRSLDPVQIRGFLRRWLPEYMVPREIVEVARIPRTASGKLDRTALGAIEAPTQHAVQAVASSPTEQWLCDTWQALTGVAVPGVDSSLFDVGGHSLVAAQLVARVSTRFGVDMPLRVVFERQTFRALAAWVDAHADAGAGTGVAAPLTGSRIRPARAREAGTWR